MWLTPLLFVATGLVNAQDGNTTAPVSPCSLHIHFHQDETKIAGCCRILSHRHSFLMPLIPMLLRQTQLQQKQQLEHPHCLSIHRHGVADLVPGLMPTRKLKPSSASSP